MAVAQEPRARAYARYRVSVEQVVTFRHQGFLVVKGLVSLADVAELAAHCEDVVAGRVGRECLGEHVGYTDATWRAGGAADAAEKRYNRIHMLHRHLEIHERFLLHPRVLDVLEALIGPDVLALQSMLFLKPPGADGQGYHQDSYYIPTLPDTLCGAWIAVDRADVDNGCVRFTVGSQHEPIYPDAGNAARHYPSERLDDLHVIDHASDTDEARNGLTPIARKYAGREVPGIAEPGDVVFFGGHILHRSLRNGSDRFRRSFVGHYCNARSYTEWDYGYAPGMANGRHILARGRTHLPYAQPLFGTPCAANSPVPERSGGTAPTMMGDVDSGMMQAAPTESERLDPAAHEG